MLMRLFQSLLVLALFSGCATEFQQSNRSEPASDKQVEGQQQPQQQKPAFPEFTYRPG
jgi:hypothetical protein